MVDIQYANSIAELLYYLKGIDEKDIRKIPTKLMNFWKENANKDYICTFNYMKPLEELQYELSDDTLGLIGMICYNFWCENEEEKEIFIEQLKKNEMLFQEEMKERFNWQRKFKKNIEKQRNEVNVEQVDLIEVKDERVFMKIIRKIKLIIKQLFEKK